MKTAINIDEDISNGPSWNGLRSKFYWKTNMLRSRIQSNKEKAQESYKKIIEIIIDSMDSRDAATNLVNDFDSFASILTQDVRKFKTRKV